MAPSLIKIVEEIYTLLNEDKEDEAWQKIAIWEKSEQLTSEEYHHYIVSKVIVFYATGKIQESLKIVEEHFK